MNGGERQAAGGRAVFFLHSVRSPQSYLPACRLSLLSYLEVGSFYIRMRPMKTAEQGRINLPYRAVLSSLQWRFPERGSGIHRRTRGEALVSELCRRECGHRWILDASSTKVPVVSYASVYFRKSKVMIRVV